jgi:hypothetical protein
VISTLSTVIDWTEKDILSHINGSDQNTEARNDRKRVSSMRARQTLSTLIVKVGVIESTQL